MARRGADESGTTRDEDAATEAALLSRLIELQPAALTRDELIRDLAGEDPGFAAEDAIGRALRELEGAGLLRREGERVAPTRAALRFSELSDR